MDFRFLDDSLSNVALQDALAFLDDYEDLVQPATPPETAHNAEESISPAAKTKKRGNGKGSGAETRVRNRGERKAELERLRLEVKVLETTAMRLKSANGPYSLPSSTSGSDGKQPDPTMAMAALSVTWKLVAVRQYQRRTQSEITNRNLRRVLEKQLKLAKTLESLYNRRANQQDSELSYDSSAMVSHYSKTPESSQDDPISRVLSGLVHQLHLALDIHLVSAGLLGPEPRALHTHSVSDHRQGTVLVTSSCAPVPLSLENADRTVWDGMAALYTDIPNVPLKEIAFLEGGGVNKSYVVVVKSVQCSYNLPVRAVTRKFVTEDRVEYAWVSIGAVANKGLRFQGEGMIMLERSPMAPSQSIMLKMWHRMHAEQVESAFGSASELEMLKVIGMKALSRNVAGYFSALENVLLEAAVDKSNRVSVPSIVSW